MKQQNAIMYNDTLTLIIRESGVKCYFASLQVLFCNTAPYRIKDFPISHLNEKCKEWIRSACRFRIVGVLPELGILLSRSCAAGAGTWLMSTWHWFEYFLEWGTTEWVIWKHIKPGQSPCVKNALHINSSDRFLLYSRTDRQDLRVLTFKTLKASHWSRDESKWSRRF